MSALRIGDTIQGQRQYDAAPVGTVVGYVVDGVLDTDELLVRTPQGWIDCDGVVYQKVSVRRVVTDVPRDQP